MSRGIVGAVSPQIVASVAEPTTQAALARMREVAPSCGLLELRLDAAPPRTLDLEALLRGAPRPVIVTARPVRDGGAWRGDEAARLAVLAHAAHLGAAWVDVEWDAVAELPELPEATRLLVSRHVLVPAPDTRAARAGFAARVDALLASVRHPRAAAGKLALAVRGADEALALLARAAKEPKPTAAIALGFRGVVSRLAGPRWGAPFVYAAAGAPTAPGQLPAARLAALLAGRDVSRATALHGILGAPIDRSRSPALLNAAFAALGVDAVHAWLETDAADALLDALDLDPLARGLTVTMPHKVAAASWLAARGGRASEAVRATGALNTLFREPAGPWSGENTDALAARELLAAAGLEAGERVSVLGTGGAARAVVFAAAKLGARVRLFGRDPADGRAVVARLSAAGDVSWGGALWDVPGAGAADAARVVVNATSIGMSPSPRGETHAPVPGDVHGPGTVAYELVLTPGETPFLAQARARGARTIGGLDHFVAQARAQLACFVGAERAARLDAAWFTRAAAAAPPLWNSPPSSGVEGRVEVARA